MKKNYPKFVLFDNTIPVDYKSYVEFCEANDIEPQEENSDDYWKFDNLSQRTFWNDLKENLRYSEQAKLPVIITGELGLWDGKKVIYPTRCDNLLAAIRKCNDRDIEYIKIEVENGVVNVDAIHHDGRNHFHIHKCSKLGDKVSSKWSNNCNNSEEYNERWFAKYKGYFVKQLN